MKTLPIDKVLNLDFDYVQSKKMGEYLYDVETNRSIEKLKKHFKDANVIEALGGVQNVTTLMNALNNSVLEQKGKTKAQEPWEKKLEQSVSFLQAKGARIALGSVNQLIKQTIPIMINTITNLGRDIDLFFEASKYKTDLPMYDELNIGLRGSTKAGYIKETDLKNIKEANFDTNNLNKGLTKATEIATKIGESSLKALEAGDVVVARQAFLAYYMKSLREQGIDISKRNFREEHKNINKKAAAYAEQMVSRNQNPNDGSSVAQIYKKRGFGGVALKAVAPFSGFSLNMRGKLTNDVYKIKSGLVGEGLQSITSTLLEQMTFNAIKLTLLGSGVKYLSDYIYEAFGLGDEDDEEEKKKKEAFYKEKQSLKFITNTVSDFLFSGMGTYTQKQLETLMNFISKAANGEEYFYHYEPEKYGESDSFSSLGIYGIPLKTASNWYELTKDLDGQTTFLTKGGFEDKTTSIDVNLTPEEKNLLAFMWTIESLNLVGFRDSYVNNINSSLQRRYKRRKEKLLGNKPILVKTKGKSSELNKRSNSSSKDDSQQKTSSITPY